MRTGAVAGLYANGATVSGFSRSRGGKFKSFDPSGSTATEATAINGTGAIAGFYSDGTVVHGFVRDTEGQSTAFDPSTSVDTEAYGINDSGATTGYYRNNNDDVTRSFIREP